MEYTISYKKSYDDYKKIITVLWSIPNFAEFLASTYQELRTNKSTDFADIEDEDAKFQLKIRFVGKSKSEIEVYYSAPRPLFLKSTLNYETKYGMNLLTKTKFVKIQSNEWQLFTYFGSQRALQNYLYSHDLRLRFQFKIDTRVQVDYSNVPKPQLNQDFENLLKNSKYSDMVIKSVEGVEFNVHKAVLSARSAVLKAHFEHNTMETMTNIIESPLETEVLQEVLTYIYTDNAPRVDEMPEKLLGAADFYQLSRLKGLCVNALHNKLTVENAIETLELADLCSADDLKRKTMEFINDNNQLLVVNSEGWTNLKSVALLKYIHEFTVKAGEY